MCTRQKDKTVVYEPSEIFGFGFKGNKYFSSQVVKDTFVEVLVAGDNGLFKLNNIFLVKLSDQRVFRFENRGSTNLSNGDVSYIVDDDRWRGLLRFILKDCLEYNETLNELKFSETDFVRSITRLNTCKGTSSKVYKKDISGLAIHPGIGIGFGLNKMNIDLQNIEYDFPLVFKSKILFPFLSFELYSPKEQAKTSVLIETQVKFYSTSSTKIIHFTSFDRTTNTKLKISQLSVPILLKQNVSKGKIGLSLVIGLNCDVIAGQSSKVVNEDKYHIVPELIINRSNDKAYHFGPVQIGYIAGILFTKQVGSRVMGLNVRYLTQINRAKHTLLGFFSGDNSSVVNAPNFIVHDLVFSFAFYK